eukprot:NODE_22_length_2518_cov_593.010936_g19_i0.p1 GENE.NODE_22_length_2518_cov_593.010936_g19_i0~~NODE_22_length_2518_cov_593.010936_g19_i0.p1  ORF type:complete len:615 (+),score=76.99 NODE_22_length_2518_cov_593.010936_g19_i0:350-2194(+)
MEFAFMPPRESSVSHRRSRSDNTDVFRSIPYDDCKETLPNAASRQRAQSWVPPRKKHRMSQVVFHPSDDTHQMASPMVPPPLDLSRTSFSSTGSIENFTYRHSSSSTSTRNTSLCGSSSESFDSHNTASPPKRPPRPERGLFDDNPAIAASRLNAWKEISEQEATEKEKKVTDEMQQLIRDTTMAFDMSWGALPCKVPQPQQTKKSPETPKGDSSPSGKTLPKSYFDTEDTPPRKSRPKQLKKMGHQSVQLPPRGMPKAMRWSLLADMLGARRPTAGQMLEAQSRDSVKSEEMQRPATTDGSGPAAAVHQEDYAANIWRECSTECSINQDTQQEAKEEANTGAPSTPTPPLPPKNPARFGQRGQVSHLPTIPESLRNSIVNDLRRRRSAHSVRLSSRSSVYSTDQTLSHYLNVTQPSQDLTGSPRQSGSEDDEGAIAEWMDNHSSSVSYPETPDIPGIPTPEEYEEEIADDMAEWFDTFGFESHGRLVAAAANPSHRGPTRSLNSIHSMDSSTSTLEDPDSPMPNKAEVIPHSQPDTQMSPMAKAHLASLSRLKLASGLKPVTQYELPLSPEMKTPGSGPRMTCNLSDGLDSFLAWNPTSVNETSVHETSFYEE